MKDIKRTVSTGFWNDDMVLNEFSPEDKYFMLYLLTNPYTTQLGVYHLPLKKVALEIGYNQDCINVLLDRFENKYSIIKYNKNTSEIAIKNYLKHSIVKGGKPVFDCLEKDAKGIKDKSLLDYVFGHLEFESESFDINKTVLEFIEKYKNDNDNDNDNERIVNESYHESYKRTRKTIPPTEEEVRSYCLQRKNHVDASKFMSHYESNGWMVGRTKMKDWQAAVRTWEHGNYDNKKGSEQSGRASREERDRELEKEISQIDLTDTRSILDL